MLDSDKRIFIPREARGRAFSTVSLSVRLGNVLGYGGFRVLGDIHGITYGEFRRLRNCGLKTITELRELVGVIQRAPAAGEADGLSPGFSRPVTALMADWRRLPASVQDLQFCELPFSGHLRNILAKRRITRLGDLNRFTFGELNHTRGFGTAKMAELVALVNKAAAGGFKTITDDNVAWSPVDLARFLDALILALPARDAQILQQCLSREKGSRSEKGWRSRRKVVVGKHELTYARVWQAVWEIAARLRFAGSRKLKAYLRLAEKECLEKVCPLTPALFEQWIGGERGNLRFSPGHYARLLCKLNPAIPIWKCRRDGSGITGCDNGPVEAELASLLKAQPRPLALAEAFYLMKAKIPNLEVGEFFAAMRHRRPFRVDFHQPERPTVTLARLAAADLARVVLEASDSPLRLEEIFLRCRTAFGQERIKFTANSLLCIVSGDEHFFRLAPGTYGLEKHLLAPKALQARAKREVAAWLRLEQRPILSHEMIQNRRFNWTGRLNRFELAGLLRLDERFVHLGRGRFALAEWGRPKRAS